MLRVVPWALVGVTCAVACGSSDNKKRALDVDGGAGGQGGAGAPAIEPLDGGEAGRPALGGAGGVPAIEGGGAGEPPMVSAGQAGEGGQPPLLDDEYLYTTLNGMLARIDLDSAELTEIGLVRDAENEATVYPDLCMVYSGTGNIAYATIGYYNGNITFAMVDLCTGLATLGPALSRPATTTLVVEGLAVAPDGTVYVASGDNASTFSVNVGTLDIETGVITNLGGTVASVENDIDHLFFADDTLYGIDVALTARTLDVFSFDLETGVSAPVVAPLFATQTQVPMRVTHAPLKGAAYAWRPSDRNLALFDPNDGSLAPIAATHAAGQYANQPVHAYFVAPTPSCQ